MHANACSLIFPNGPLPTEIHNTGLEKEMFTIHLFFSPDTEPQCICYYQEPVQYLHDWYVKYTDLVVWIILIGHHYAKECEVDVKLQKKRNWFE